MTTPLLSLFEARTQHTFGALMWAFSYPGRTYPLDETGLAAFAALGAALLDLETSYYTNQPELARLLALSGARPQAPHLAHYQFYPELTDTALRELNPAPVGTYADPDTSATLVLGCTFGAGQRLRLSGPGLASPSLLALGGLPPALWELRAAVGHFPLGWDIFFIAGDQLIGLPRSTHVEVL